MLDKNRAIIQQVADVVRKKFEGEGTGHDWWHIYRVWRMSSRLSAQYKDVDRFVVELAALVHDMADHKLMENPSDGENEIKRLLFHHQVSEDGVNRVLQIVRHVSFKGAKVKDKMESLEGQIVQDADRLDAIGAIGIARTFAYGGSKARELYNPAIPVEEHDNFAAYKNSEAPTINHFYEKLLLLKDRLNTEAAVKIAEERHRFMEEFLERFYDEWEGKR